MKTNVHFTLPSHVKLVDILCHYVSHVIQDSYRIDIWNLFTEELQWHTFMLKLNTWFEWVFKIWIVFHLKVISDHRFCCFVYCKPTLRFNLFSFIDFNNLSEWLANLKTLRFHSTEWKSHMWIQKWYVENQAYERPNKVIRFWFEMRAQRSKSWFQN